MPVFQQPASLAFTNGGAHRVNLSAIPNTTDMQTGTYMVLFRPTSTPLSQRMLLSKGTLASQGCRYLQYRTTGYLRFFLDAATTDLTYTATSQALTVGLWHYCFVTFNLALGAGLKASLYVGRIDSPVTKCTLTTTDPAGATTGDSSTNFIVGNTSGNNNAPIGEIAIVGIWDRELTLSEMEAQRRAPWQPIAPGNNLTYLPMIGRTPTDPQRGVVGTVTTATWSASPPIPWINRVSPWLISQAGSGSSSISITDTAAGSDAVSIAAAVGLTETGSGTDTATIQAALAVTDTGAGADVETIQAALAITDTGVGTDAQSILASLGITDLGSGVDSPTILVNLDVSDTAAGLDNLVVQALVAITDAASASEALSILTGVLISIADAGVGADAVGQILAALSLADQGSGSDTLTGQVQLSVSDAGSSTESVVVTIAGRVIVKITFALGMGAMTTVLAAGRIGAALAAGHIDGSFTAGRVDANLSVGQILVDQFQ